MVPYAFNVLPRLLRLSSLRSTGSVFCGVLAGFILANDTFASMLYNLEARLEHVIPHDLRRTAITRWTDLRIPRDFVMVVSGHKPSNVHDRYLNFTDRQLTGAFQIVMVSPDDRQKLFPWCSQEKTVENVSAASY